jgi:prevent-host-death family protein
LSLESVASPKRSGPRQLSRIASSEAREELAELINAVAWSGTRVILQRHGKNVAALVSMDDLEKLAARIPKDVPVWPDMTMRREG